MEKDPKFYETIAKISLEEAHISSDQIPNRTSPTFIKYRLLYELGRGLIAAVLAVASTIEQKE